MIGHCGLHDCDCGYTIIKLKVMLETVASCIDEGLVSMDDEARMSTEDFIDNMAELRDTVMNTITEVEAEYA